MHDWPCFTVSSLVLCSVCLLVVCLSCWNPCSLFGRLYGSWLWYPSRHNLRTRHLEMKDLVGPEPWRQSLGLFLLTCKMKTGSSMLNGCSWQRPSGQNVMLLSIFINSCVLLNKWILAIGIKATMNLYSINCSMQERYKIRSRVQRPAEPVATFLSELHALSVHCNSIPLNDMLQNQLVCGINDDQMQEWLLLEPKLTTEQATVIAQSIESAAKTSISCKVQSLHRSQPRSTRLDHLLHTPQCTKGLLLSVW